MRFSDGRLKWLTLVLAGIMGAIGLAILVLWLPNQLQERQFLQGSKLYEDKERGFSFRFPNSWEFVPERDLKNKNEKFVIGIQYPSRKSVAAGVIVEEKDPQKKLEFEYEDFVKALEQQLSTLKDYKKLNVREIERSGYHGVDISYIYLHPSKALVRQRQLILVAEHSIYYLSLTSLNGEYNLYRKSLEGIFNSFQVIKKSSEINLIVD